MSALCLTVSPECDVQDTANEENLMSAKLGLGLVVLAMGAALLAGAADAQTAKNVKCKGCVHTRDIADKAVKPKKLHKSARPAAAVNAYTHGSITVAHPNAVTAQTNTVTVPSKGQLVVHASWRWLLGDGDASHCTITLNSEAFISNAFTNRGSHFAGTATNQIPGSAGAVFTDVPAGEHTVRLLCIADTDDILSVQYRSLTTQFVPGKL